MYNIVMLLMATFGDWMREKRTALRLKSYECAERAQMTPQQWSNWENDRTRKADGSPTVPRPETIRRIAAALEVPAKDAMRAAGLFTEADEETDPQNEDAPEYDPNQDDPQVMAYYNGLPEYVQEDVKAQLEALWKKHHRDQTTHGKKAE